MRQEPPGFNRGAAYPPPSSSVEVDLRSAEVDDGSATVYRKRRGSGALSCAFRTIGRWAAQSSVIALQHRNEAFMSRLSQSPGLWSIRQLLVRLRSRSRPEGREREVIQSAHPEYVEGHERATHSWFDKLTTSGGSSHPFALSMSKGVSGPSFNPLILSLSKDMSEPPTHGSTSSPRAGATPIRSP